MVSDGLFKSTGIQSSSIARATDLARDLNGDPLTLKFFHDKVNSSIIGFSAPETSAVRYLMSDACRVNLQYSSPC